MDRPWRLRSQPMPPATGCAIAGALMASYNLPGVIGLMTGLLVVQIVLVWAWGIEPARRRLEEIEPAAAAV